MSDRYEVLTTERYTKSVSYIVKASSEEEARDMVRTGVFSERPDYEISSESKMDYDYNDITCANLME